MAHRKTREIPAADIERQLAHAWTMHEVGRLDEAALAYERILKKVPGHADALHLRGLLAHQQGESAAALVWLKRALAAGPPKPAYHNTLGIVLLALDRYTEAAANLGRSLALKPGYGAALANLGLVRQAQARYAEAVTCYDAVLAQNPGHVQARANRAVALLLLGRWSEGWRDYEARWQVPGFTTRARAFGKPLWDGGALNGRTLLLHAEQGMGSAIQFARYVPLAAAQGGRIVVECQGPLVSLFRQSLVKPDDAVARVFKRGEAWPPFDLHCPFMSLPRLLGTTPATVPADVPYLQVAPERIAFWQARFETLPRPRVGLVWAGNPGHINDRNRSLPLTALDPLVSGQPGLGWISLQVGASADDRAHLASANVADISRELMDFAETAAAVAALDLVISVDTAVAHLAGALARPVWLMLPYVPDWRWLLERADTPWYPTMRLFRQANPGDWPGVVDHLRAALASFASEGS